MCNNIYSCRDIVGPKLLPYKLQLDTCSPFPVMRANAYACRYWTNESI